MIRNYAFALQNLLAFKAHACPEFVNTTLCRLHQSRAFEFFMSIPGYLKYLQAHCKMLVDAMELEHQPIRVLVLFSLGSTLICFGQMHFQMIQAGGGNGRGNDVRGFQMRERENLLRPPNAVWIQ